MRLFRRTLSLIPKFISTFCDGCWKGGQQRLLSGGTQYRMIRIRQIGKNGGSRYWDRTQRDVLSIHAFEVFGRTPGIEEREPKSYFPVNSQEALNCIIAHISRKFCGNVCNEGVVMAYRSGMTELPRVDDLVVDLWSEDQRGNPDFDIDECVFCAPNRAIVFYVRSHRIRPSGYSILLGDKVLCL